MRKSLSLSAVAVMSLSPAALADVPSVAVDIPPVHSLAAIVMDGVGEPHLIVQPGGSPHSYALRPSEARALQDADIVFWIGHDLTPWLEEPIGALAGDARSVELVETPGTTVLEFRKGATFASHNHGDDGHGNDARGDNRQHDEHHHHGHDPHAWLDPENGRVWLDAIASELADLDPENAETYRANAAGGKENLSELIEEIAAQLHLVRDRNFIVFHDAYQYFENRFDFPAVGSISLSDASDPSPSRIAEVRETVGKLDVICAFSEPQFNAGLVETVFGGTDARTGVVDPLGTELQIGAQLYPRLIRSIADSLVACLG